MVGIGVEGQLSFHVYLCLGVYNFFISNKFHSRSVSLTGAGNGGSHLKMDPNWKVK